MNRKIITSITIILFIITSCLKENPVKCPKEFNVSGKIKPYDSIYHLNDTIKLSIKFSKNVIEKNLNKAYNLQNISFDPSLRVIRIDSGNYLINQKTNEFINLIYSSDSTCYWYKFTSDGNAILKSHFTFERDTFSLDLKITFAKKGLFIIEFGESFENSSVDFEGKCKNTNFEFHTILNPPKDNNLDLLKQSPIEYYNEWLINHPDKFYKRGSYVLKIM